MTDKATDGVTVTQADIDLAVRIANLCGVELDDSPDTMPSQWIARHRAASEKPASGEVADVVKFIDDLFKPWGSWKTLWWEGEVSDDAAFSADNALKHVANKLRALSTTSEAPAQEDQK